VGGAGEGEGQRARKRLTEGGEVASISMKREHDGGGAGPEVTGE
jgi:hypothetical protein